ncbi:MAG TPA: DUF58 domain-containing protein, partial [Verrucomicrobiae bacterium]
MKWIIGTLVLLCIGLMSKLDLLVYAMYALLGVLLFSRYFANQWTQTLFTKRTCNESFVEIGEPVEVELGVQNQGTLSIPWLLLEESFGRAGLAEVPPRLKVEGEHIKVMKLVPDEVGMMRYRVTFLTRGYFQLGPVLLETGDVFGLHRRYRVETEPHFVMVLPKVLPLQGYTLASQRPIGEIRIAHRLFEDPTRLAGIRPYQQGDALNRIHWRATARAGSLHSRLYETSRVTGAIFLLDFYRDSYPGIAGAPAMELAVTTVASLTNAVFLQGEQVGFASNGADGAERVRLRGWPAEFVTHPDVPAPAMRAQAGELRPVMVPTLKGADQLQHILEALGRLEPTGLVTFDEFLEEFSSDLRRDATVVPVLGKVTARIAHVLGELVRRGYTVHAIVILYEHSANPDWAQPPEWAAMLMAQEVKFQTVTSEESIPQVCA